MTPLGVRVNNPGNLEKSTPAIPWAGLLGYKGPFCEFATAADGWHALCKDLLNQQRLHGLRTVDAIISKFAPPSENNTEAYVKAVSAALGVKADAELNMADADTLFAFAKAVAHQEQGGNYWDDQTIRAAVQAVVQP